MLCKFEPIPEQPGRVRCRNCGHESKGVRPGMVQFRACGKTPSETFRREVAEAQQRVKPRPTAATTAAPCAHRGEQVSTIGCEQCGKNVQLKVFACAVHGECVVGQTREGVKGCAGCADRPLDRQQVALPVEVMADADGAVTLDLGADEAAGFVGVGRVDGGNPAVVVEAGADARGGSQHQGGKDDGDDQGGIED
jgi:hypothetical protein